MEENLLGYLLGALDSPEHEQLTEELRRDPQLRVRLRALEQKLEPLQQGRWQHEPPPDLAARTCAAAAACAPPAPVGLATRMTGGTLCGGGRGRSWNLTDAVVAAGIFLSASMLFFPAISNSRQQARLATCQNNLRLGSVALSLFGERFAGMMPYIPTQGNAAAAGFYAPQLVDGGYLTEHHRFLCPSSPLARQRLVFRVPQIDEILRAQGAKLILLHRQMGGSYMYSLGHFENGRHSGTRNSGRAKFPVLSDSFQASDGRNDLGPHGGLGINVAFEDGHVELLSELSPLSPYFVSDHGLVEAGANRDDAVLAPSWARPVHFGLFGSPSGR